MECSCCVAGDAGIPRPLHAHSEDDNATVLTLSCCLSFSLFHSRIYTEVALYSGAILQIHDAACCRLQPRLAMLSDGTA